MDTLRTWLSHLETYGAEMTLAADYFFKGNLTESNNILSNIPTKFDLTPAQSIDLSNTQTIFSSIDNQSIYKLGENSLNQIAAIAEEDGEFAPGLAQNLMTLYGNNFSPLVCSFNKNDAQDGKVPPFKSSIKEELLVYPNPAQNEVWFKWGKTEEKSISKLIISNSLGKVIASFSFENNIYSFNWNTNQLSSGVYYYRFLLDNNIYKSGKIILNK